MSPLALLQEQVSTDADYPWRVMLACILLNRTGGPAAHRIAGELLHAFGDSPMFFQCKCEHCSALRLRILEPLGLANRRAALLLDMTDDYLACLDPKECRGVGPYARDALAIFCEGRTDIEEPADHYLRAYLEWRRAGGPRVAWDEDGYVRWVARNAPSQQEEQGERIAADF